MKEATLTLYNIKEYNMNYGKKGDYEDRKLSVELDDGAKCNFKDNTLDCKIEGITLKSTKTIKPSDNAICKGKYVGDLKTECKKLEAESCEKLKSCDGREIKFEVGEDTKVTYTGQHLTYDTEPYASQHDLGIDIL